MQSLSIGASGPAVLALQRLLNKRGATPPLVEDERFGQRTAAAVSDFKRSRRLSPADGSVGPPMWIALGLTLDVTHNVTLYAQPTNMSCWSAAATMMGGNLMSVGPGGATSSASGGLNMGLANIETFIRSRNLRMITNSSRPALSALLGPLTAGPVWLAFEGGTFEHAVVASAAWGDRTEDGTVLRIHDPWPPGRGTIYGTTYLRGEVILRSAPNRPHAMIQYAAAA